MESLRRTSLVDSEEVEQIRVRERIFVSPLWTLASVS